MSVACLTQHQGSRRFSGSRRVVPAVVALQQLGLLTSVRIAEASPKITPGLLWSRADSQMGSSIPWSSFLVLPCLTSLFRRCPYLFANFGGYPEAGFGPAVVTNTCFHLSANQRSPTEFYHAEGPKTPLFEVFWGLIFEVLGS